MMGVDITANDRTRGLTIRLLLTKAEVAAILGVESGTVEGLHRTGSLRGTHVGKALHWKLEWVQAYVDTLVQDD